MKQKEWKRLERFAANLFAKAETGTRPPKSFAPLTWRDFEYHAEAALPAIESGSHRIVLITDTIDPGTNLDRSCISSEARCAAILSWLILAR